jgi:hypothetical protein
MSPRPRSSSRRPGRPPLAANAPSVSVHIRLPAPDYDRAYAAARHERLTVPAWIRQRVTGRVPPREDEEES